MGPWTLITVLVAMQVSIAWTGECNDRCLCPVGKTIVDCSSRGLSQPPPGYWPDITILYLRRNNICDLSKWSLTGFPNVEVINLESNLLTEFDLETFSALPFLSTLYLSLNPITTITAPPPGVTIGSLQYLYLENNRLYSIDPNALAAATGLMTLIMSNNPLVVQAGQPLLNHPTLMVLQLQNGSSLNYGPATFAGLPRLRQINLFYMGLTSIDGLFVNNPLLSIIRLSGNLITEVNEESFAPDIAIGRLVLSLNPLERLDVAALENALVIPRAFLEIQDTTMACNCDYEELYWWAQERGVNLLAQCKNQCPFTQQFHPTQ